MKKLLLATTSLVGAAALAASASAAAPELSISGNLDVRMVGGQNQATAQTTATNPAQTGETTRVGNGGWNMANSNSVSEIKFNANGETDDGISYGADVQYRYLISATDEAFIYISGDFGKIVLGQDDGAYNATVPYAGSVGAGPYGIDGGTTGMEPQLNAAYNDSNKIKFQSNDMNGLKFNVSIDPEQTDANAGGTDVNYENMVEAGVSYSASVGEGSFTIAAAHIMASAVQTSVDATARIEDMSETGFGVKASFGPVSVAASISDEGDSGLTQTQTTSDGMSGAVYRSIGASYDLGAATVSASHATTEWDTGATTSTDESLTVFEAGFEIMPGMAGYAGVALSESVTNGDNDVTNDFEGTTYVVGTTISF